MAWPVKDVLGIVRLSIQVQTPLLLSLVYLPVRLFGSGEVVAFTGTRCKAKSGEDEYVIKIGNQYLWAVQSQESKTVVESVVRGDSTRYSRLLRSNQ